MEAQTQASTDPGAEPQRASPGLSGRRVWLARILAGLLGVLAGAGVGFLVGATGFALGPWGHEHWPQGLGLYIGGPLLGAIAGAVAGVIGRPGRGAVVGVAIAALSLLLVVVCTVVDLDQALGVGLVLLIAGTLAGAVGGALGGPTARSYLARPA